MSKIDPRLSYAMPAHFGPRPIGKVTGWYRDVTAIMVSYLTDSSAIRARLPEPFEPIDDPVITVAYARNRKVDWLAGHGYNLIAVSTPARYNGPGETLDGRYTLVMWENLTDPILTGRELQGVPKIYADIPDHTVDDGVWRASASHFGHDIVALAASDLQPVPKEMIAAEKEANAAKDNPFGWRYMPGVSGFGTSINEPTLFPSENHVERAWVGAGSINWRELTWEQNPTQHHIVNALAALPVIEIRPAIVTEGAVNLILPENLPRALG